MLKVQTYRDHTISEVNLAEKAVKGGAHYLALDEPMLLVCNLILAKGP